MRRWSLAAQFKVNNIDVSIVIPVKNGQRYLDSVLKAVFSQEIDSKFEVIIIDSGSTDKTLDIVKQYPLRYFQIEEDKFNHGLTRNFGISKAQGKYIVLMTQDAIPYDNHWMRKLVDNLKRNQSIAGVYSRQIPHKDSCPLAQIRTDRFFTSNKVRIENQIDKIEDYNKLSPQEKHRFCNFDDVSSCIRKDVWNKIPFPDTDFAEDLVWAKQVLEAGYKIVYEPDSIVYHSHNFSILGWYKRNRINYNKLRTLFGTNTIDHFYKLLVFFLIYTFRDFYYLCKQKKQIKIILSTIHLIPLFSFAGLLGQYKSSKDSSHRNKSYKNISNRP